MFPVDSFIHFLYYFCNLFETVKAAQCDETSTISTMPVNPLSDISYSVRHVEESWHHLIKSDDVKKLKEIAVCNFDFLLAAVRIIIFVYIFIVGSVCGSNLEKNWSL